MSDLLTIKLNDNIASVETKIEGAKSDALSRVATAMDTRNQATKGYIQQNKLSQKGPRTLGVISGRLRQSASATPSKISGNVVASSLGSNVKYAAFHEFGFTGQENVRAHSRTVKINRPSFDTLGRERRSKKYNVTGQVRAHTRNVDAPGRHMFGDGVRENADRYVADISAAYAGAFKEGVGQ